MNGFLKWDLWWGTDRTFELTFKHLKLFSPEITFLLKPSWPAEIARRNLFALTCGFNRRSGDWGARWTLTFAFDSGAVVAALLPLHQAGAIGTSVISAILARVMKAGSYPAQISDSLNTKVSLNSLFHTPWIYQQTDDKCEASDSVSSL